MHYYTLIYTYYELWWWWSSWWWWIDIHFILLHVWTSGLVWYLLTGTWPQVPAATATAHWTWWFLGWHCGIIVGAGVLVQNPEADWAELAIIEPVDSLMVCWGLQMVPAGAPYYPGPGAAASQPSLPSASAPSDSDDDSSSSSFLALIRVIIHLG